MKLWHTIAWTTQSAHGYNLSCGCSSSLDSYPKPVDALFFLSSLRLLLLASLLTIHTFGFFFRWYFCFLQFRFWKCLVYLYCRSFNEVDVEWRAFCGLESFNYPTIMSDIDSSSYASNKYTIIWILRHFMQASFTNQAFCSARFVYANVVCTMILTT